MIAQRPPAATTSGNAASSVSRFSSSAFTAIRRAWNVRVAAWIFDLRCSALGIARVHSAASCSVVVSPPIFSSSLIMRAIRFA